MTNIQNNDQKNYKNLKVLTNNNSSLKSTIKTNEILTKQNNSTAQNNFNQSNVKNSKNEKAKSYTGLNLKREEQNKVINTQQQQKQKIFGKN